MITQFLIVGTLLVLDFKLGLRRLSRLERQQEEKGISCILASSDGLAAGRRGGRSRGTTFPRSGRCSGLALSAGRISADFHFDIELLRIENT